MATASPTPVGWRCVPCAIFAGVTYADPVSATDICADCKAPASPCAVLRHELGVLREEIRALKATPVPGGAGATDAEEQPMTAQQVAEYLGMTRAAVYMAAHRCRLPFHRVGNSRLIRFLKSEIDAELARR